MNEKEFNAVIKLPANVRYEYFIKKVVDYETVWGLYDDGWAVQEDDNGNKLLPFWPKKAFAEYCSVGEWANYSTESIELYDFIQEFLPLLLKEGYKPSIFHNNIDSAVLEIQTLITDLKAELEKYE